MHSMIFIYRNKIDEDLMEIEVDYNGIYLKYLTLGNKSVIKFKKKIARDLYCYYGAVIGGYVRTGQKDMSFTGNGIEFIIQNFK